LRVHDKGGEIELRVGVGYSRADVEALIGVLELEARFRSRRGDEVAEDEECEEASEHGPFLEGRTGVVNDE
jgi:hypothetical protein